MTWAAEAADKFRSNRTRLNSCDAGHDHHDTKVVHIDLSGYWPLVPDYPPIPNGLEQEFDLVIYDWEKYDGTPMYCSGNDSVSASIDTQGVWEGFESVLALAILRDGSRDGLVIDMGSHVGWYTMLASGAGYEVLAVDGDRENLDLLQWSTELNGFENVRTAHGWIGADTPTLSPDGPNVRLLKADIEGAEDEALRICYPLFTAGKIEYAFLEISPEFSPHYPDTVQTIMDCGYDAYFIPDKGTPIELFSADPLGYTTNPTSKITKQDVAALRIQHNAVFVRS